MNQFRICILLLLAVFVFPNEGKSQTVRKYSNEFLNIGVGASALGMSNSNTALVGDVTSGYWNPAGLTRIENNIEIGLMHASYFASIAQYEYGAVAFKIDDQSAASISYMRFGVDNIPNTADLIDANGNINYDKITSFSSADNAFLFSYARKTGVEGLSIGGSAKVIYRQVGAFAHAWGFGLDGGAQYQTGNWRFAAMARDVTSTFSAWSFNLDQFKDVFAATGNAMPTNSIEIALPRLILAAGHQFTVKDDFGIYPELDLDMTFDGKRNTLVSSNFASIDPHIGLQLSYKNMIYIRGGAGNIQKESNFKGEKITTFQPNIGLGLKLAGFSLDYALTDIGDNSAAVYSNVFSLRIDINRGFMRR
ncbi:MAG: PorV/PorQ family protein [Bacteroidetes bacterium]|nr:PorV/PorQ family protein [Bacteroidota bacterium]